MKLSDNFTVEEFQHSDTAVKHAIPNKLPAELTDNAKRCCMVLEWIRKELGQALFLNCGYRSPKVNALVGGVPNSVHQQGCAADVRLSAETQKKLMGMMSSCPIPFDQVINYPTRGFIHVGVSPKDPNGGRRQLLTSPIKGKYEVYKA